MMSIFHQLLDFVLHIDQHLTELVQTYHETVYLILALIIFCETGLVFTPFLPGDSLLFAAGAIAARPDTISIQLLLPLLFVAAVFGDSSNYWIGKLTGQQLVASKRNLIKKEYLDKTHSFYQLHGGKTVVLARFMPILRTFAPFVAGLGAMDYRKFLSFSVIGNLLWISIFTLAGFAFGNIPWVQKHFSTLILGIILISLLPMLIAYLRGRLNKQEMR